MKPKRVIDFSNLHHKSKENLFLERMNGEGVKRV